jgi:para-nitrobenzyl esterase
MATTTSTEIGRWRTVATSAGHLRGVDIDGIATFLGIPYGDRVDGEWRFRPPRPHPGWSGVRDALTFGAGGPQADPRVDVDPVYHRVLRLLYPGVPTPLEGRASGENCLFLNVWASSSEGPPKPVMVWLHGGAFVHGTGAEGWFQGDRLAASGDVLVVTVNHRLGLLGFLPPTPELGEEAELSGLAGILDVVEALRWVHTNIAAFGGDPGNVTIFGQSGGGAKVSTLLAMPGARGLFHKAIIQSGAGLRSVTPEDAERTLHRVLADLDLADAGELRSLPAEQLFAVQEAATEGALMQRLGPVLHERELPAHPFDGVPTPLGAGIPLLIGSTTHEVALMLSEHRWFHELTEAELPARFEDLAGEGWREVLDVYRAREGDAVPQLVLARAASDRRFVAASRKLRDLKTTQPADVYSYRFDYRAGTVGGILGAHHSLDLPFVFDNVDRSPVAGRSEERFAVSGRVARAWASFARTGSPRTREFGDWRPFGESGETYRIGLASGPEHDPPIPDSLTRG